MTGPDGFEYAHAGTHISYGRGAVDQVADVLAAHGLERALVVCGANVGANRELMAAVRTGLGDRLAGVFDGTTPAKRAEEVYGAVEALHATNADVFVGLGGGSSLDIARQASSVDADGRSLTALREEFRERGTIEPPSGDDATPIVVIPTTFAGADISGGGSFEVFAAEESPTGQPVRTYGYVRPIAVVHDPNLFATTPVSALAGSAMNGFNKGLDTIYARDHAAITDATAVRGLNHLVHGLPRLEDDAGLERAVVGSILVQFDRQTNVLHAFGHAFARRYDVQQGVAHATVTPEVLAFLLERVDARRTVLAEGLGIDVGEKSDTELADSTVASVRSVRDSLDLPTRLRDLDGVERDDLDALGRYVVDDAPMERAPPGFKPTADEVTALLRELW